MHPKDVHFWYYNIQENVGQRLSVWKTANPRTAAAEVEVEVAEVEAEAAEEVTQEQQSALSEPGAVVAVAADASGAADATATRGQRGGWRRMLSGK
jgi:hypothetical protein